MSIIYLFERARAMRGWGEKVLRRLDMEWGAPCEARSQDPEIRP